jgi:hypothetical protein
MAVLYQRRLSLSWTGWDGMGCSWEDTALSGSRTCSGGGPCWPPSRSGTIYGLKSSHLALGGGWGWTHSRRYFACWLACVLACLLAYLLAYLLTCLGWLADDAQAGGFVRI